MRCYDCHVNWKWANILCNTRHGGVLDGASYLDPEDMFDGKGIQKVFDG
jgi:hypothetical protein